MPIDHDRYTPFVSVSFCREDIADLLRNDGLDDDNEELLDDIVRRCKRMEDVMVEAGWDFLHAVIEESLRERKEAVYFLCSVSFCKESLREKGEESV